MADDLRSRVVNAAHDCFARVGVAKTSLDDVAREAGCSRATLYRHVSGKRELVDAVAEREVVRLDAVLADAVEPASDLADACARLIVEGASFLLDHPVLGTILAIEPALVLPYLSIGADEFLAEAAGLVGRHLRDFVADPADCGRIGELLVRITLSHLQCPDELRSIIDPHVAHHIVDQYIVPGFVSESATGRTQV